MKRNNTYNSNIQEIRNLIDNNNNKIDSQVLNNKINELFKYNIDAQKIEEIDFETNLQIKLEKLNEVISNIFSLSFDKDSLLEALIRVITVINNCNLPVKDKLYILISLFYQIHNNDNSIFRQLKVENSFFRSRNYNIPAVLAGLLQGLSGGLFGIALEGVTYSVLGLFDLSVILQGASSLGVGFILTSFINSYSNAPLGKTKSFTTSLEFIKKIIDSLLDSEEGRNFINENPHEWENIKKLKETIFSEKITRWI